MTKEKKTEKFARSAFFVYFCRKITNGGFYSFARADFRLLGSDRL
jgi:hypothetical protein